MNDVLERIRLVFLSSGKNQTEIGKKIGKTPQYIWKLLNDDNAKASESVMRDICREFNVNETWLRTGEGDMYIIPDDDVGTLVSEILENPDDRFYQSILNLVRTYKQLSPESKYVLTDFIDKLLQNNRTGKP